MESWKIPLRCDVCGRFIRNADLESGAARNGMIIPDSYYTWETSDTTCWEHTPGPIHDSLTG